MSQNPFADPYQSPQALPTTYAQLVPGQRPPVWTWYVVYCVAMALMYLLCAGLGILIAFVAEPDAPEDRIMGFILLAMGLVLFLLFAAGPLLPRSRLSWIWGFVTIGIGLTSCCTMPFSIPLLIFWLKPELKAYLNCL